MGTEMSDNSSAHTQGPSPQPLPCQEQVPRALPQPVQVPGALRIPQPCVRLGGGSLARHSETRTRRATPLSAISFKAASSLRSCGTSAHRQWLLVGLLCSIGAIDMGAQCVQA